MTDFFYVPHYALKVAVLSPPNPNRYGEAANIGRFSEFTVFHSSDLCKLATPALFLMGSILWVAYSIKPLNADTNDCNTAVQQYGLRPSTSGLFVIEARPKANLEQICEAVELASGLST